MFCAREINLPEGYRKCFNFLPYDYRNIPHSFLAQTNFKIVVEVDFIVIFLAPLINVLEGKTCCQEYVF